MSIQKRKSREVDRGVPDAPPLDFTFKNIKTLQEIKFLQPRQGIRLNPVDEFGKPIDIKVPEKEQIEVEAEQINKNENEAKGDKKKNEITKLLPENNISSIVSNLVTTSAMKNISTKAKEQLEKQKKKSVKPKTFCSTLLLSYNKIRQLINFEPVVSYVMPDYKQNLLWIDLSHNYLQKLDYDFSCSPNLCTLYLHCNYLYDLNDFSNLSKLHQLKTLMIHGNPLTEISNFRFYLISLLPKIRKIDSVLISKKEVDNAIVLKNQVKKMPIPKNPVKPPVEKTEEDDEEKESG